MESIARFGCTILPRFSARAPHLNQPIRDVRSRPSTGNGSPCLLSVPRPVALSGAPGCVRTSRPAISSIPNGPTRHPERRHHTVDLRDRRTFFEKQIGFAQGPGGASGWRRSRSSCRRRTDSRSFASFCDVAIVCGAVSRPRTISSSFMTFARAEKMMADDIRSTPARAGQRVDVEPIGAAVWVYL